uniref:CSON012690 protein n=1 Tax=Culicoides sonorensis TaxID=179676 RepID=A0A336MAB9_CULSO
METDAALASEDPNWVNSVATNQQNIRKIELDDLVMLEKELEIYEKIAAIFLLYGSDKDLVNAGIQHILYILRNASQHDTSFLYQWAKSKGGNWQEFLVEALCVIQSYHITEKLLLDMAQLEEVYLPQRVGTSLYINSHVKCLYLMAERMVQKECDSLITYMRDKSTSNFESIPNTNHYIELYLLDWIRFDLIDVHNLTEPKVGLIYNFLKEFEIVDALEALDPIKSQNKTKSVNEEKILNIDSTFKKIYKNLSKENRNDCYKIQKETCGWVLIINQKVFTKPDPDKIPPGVQIEEHLGMRVGTDADCKLLEKTFKARGYRIDQRDNLTHIQIQKALNDIVEASVIYDSLIVCILSHGNKGVVFGADYVPVKISTIQEILSSEKLLNKPKVLIVQACQGKEKNITVTQESSMRSIGSRFETDGAVEQNSAPKYADLLTAMSTIEGFVSIRDRELGTWYINEVCSAIDAHGDDEHMLDLLTFVNNKVSGKRHKENERELCMLPEFSVRLLKKFYLPKKRNI